MEKPEYVERLEKQACTCTTCSECRGSGNVWFSFGGRHYLGHRRSDDLDEMETCDHCRGSGIAEVCDRCQQLRDYDEDSMCA